MNKMDYDSSLARQSRLAPGFLKTMQQTMTEEKLVSTLPLKELWDAQQIIITGCGDSWLAGIAAKPVFESVAKMDVKVMRNIEFTRYLGSKMLGYSPNTPLVIAISISGNVSRVVEAVMRAKHYGANTILITNNPNSAAAKEARYVLPLEMPQGEYQPGGNSYIASTFALMQLALRFARAKNTVSPLELDAMQKGFGAYADAWAAALPEMEDRAFELAKTWKDLRAYDFIGDYAEYATAFFGSAKVLECFGGYTTYDDSEDWCHINYFLREPETIGRVAITNSDTPSFGRMKETLKAVEQLGSHCMVVTDAGKGEFASSFQVFTTPKAPFFWMAPLLQHIPFDYVAGYMGRMKGVEDFRHDVPVFELLNKAPHRLTQSQIEII